MRYDEAVRLLQAFETAVLDRLRQAGQPEYAQVADAYDRARDALLAALALAPEDTGDVSWSDRLTRRERQERGEQL